jgi:hypothetical protein
MNYGRKAAAQSHSQPNKSSPLAVLEGKVTRMALKELCRDVIFACPALSS